MVRQNRTVRNAPIDEKELCVPISAQILNLDTDEEITVKPKFAKFSSLYTEKLRTDQRDLSAIETYVLRAFGETREKVNKKLDEEKRFFEQLENKDLFQVKVMNQHEVVVESYQFFVTE
eukprot:UN32592